MADDTWRNRHGRRGWILVL